MKKPTLGWQSWSPPNPNFFRIPRRDYPPDNLSTDLILSSNKSSPLNLTYWCSWYAYGWNINPSVIINEAKAIKKNGLNIDCILIDDGWKIDWILSLSHELHDLGFKVGLWYGPYTRHKHLSLNSTLNKLIDECHLDVLKLDFLYKPYFDPRNSNPSQTLRDLFSSLSSTYPKLITIGCGVPFQDAIGKVSAIRFSKDTAFPPYLPAIINRLVYSHRIKMLYQKYLIWEKLQTFSADPDVRMFSLDTVKTEKLWSKMPLSIKGIGDKISQLHDDELNKALLWLKD